MEGTDPDMKSMRFSCSRRGNWVQSPRSGKDFDINKEIEREVDKGEEKLELEDACWLQLTPSHQPAPWQDTRCLSSTRAAQWKDHSTCHHAVWAVSLVTNDFQSRTCSSLTGDQGRTEPPRFIKVCKFREYRDPISQPQILFWSSVTCQCLFWGLTPWCFWAVSHNTAGWSFYPRHN